MIVHRDESSDVSAREGKEKELNHELGSSKGARM